MDCLTWNQQHLLTAYGRFQMWLVTTSQFSNSLTSKFTSNFCPVILPSCLMPLAILVYCMQAVHLSRSYVPSTCTLPEYNEWCEICTLSLWEFSAHKQESFWGKMWIASFLWQNALTEVWPHFKYDWLFIKFMTWLVGFVFDLYDSKFHLCLSVSGSIRRAQRHLLLQGLHERLLWCFCHLMNYIF